MQLHHNTCEDCYLVPVSTPIMSCFQYFLQWRRNL